jgi:D-Tyr-tRNAtyr deacylase
MVYTIVVHLYAKDDKEAIEKIKAKLVEASQVYSKDHETLNWHVMQVHLALLRIPVIRRLTTLKG